MLKHSKIIGRHTGVIIVEILAVVIVLLAIAGGLVASRLQTGPIDVDFAVGYIEEELQNRDRGTYATISDAALEWPDLKGPLILNVNQLKFFNARGRMIMSIDNAALSISKAALLIGRIAPVGLIINKPEMRIVRRKDGGLSLGFGSRKNPDAADASATEEQKEFTARILQFVARPGKIAGENEPLATLETFEIRDAHIRVEDRQNNTAFHLPSADFIFKARDEGLSASFYESFRPVGLQDSFLKADLLIPWDGKNIYFKTLVQNFDINRVAGGKVDDTVQGPRESAHVSAELVAILDGNLNPVNMRLLAKSNNGRLMLPGIYSDAVPYKDLSVQAVYNGRDRKLILSDTHVTARDVTLNLNAQMTKNQESISGPVMLSIKDLPQEKIPPLWPDLIEKEKARRWITEKISGTTYRNLYGALNFSLEKGDEGWESKITDIHAGFDFENMNVDYRPPMTPVSAGRGKGLFDLQKDILRIEIASARIGNLQAGGSVVELGNLVKDGPGTAALDLDITGPLAAGLDYLSKEPIHMKAGFDPVKSKGDLDLNVKVNFPTSEDIPLSAVKIDGEGTLSNAFIPDVMQKFTISGGPYKISVKDNEFVLSGTGLIEGQQIDLDYREFLETEGKAYKSKIVAKLNAGAELQKKIGIDLSDYILQPLPLSLVYTQYANAPSDAVIDADLTSIPFEIAPFGYSKKPGTKASAHLTAKIQDGVLKEINDFKIEAPRLSLNNIKLSFAQKSSQTKLARASIDNFKIADSEGKLNVESDVATGGYKISMSTNYFNLSPFILDKSQKIGPFTPIHLNLTTRNMGMTNNVIFGPSTINLERNALGHFNSFELKADSGKGPLTVSYVTDSSGRRAFIMDAEDAGTALKAFDVYSSMQGGKLKIAAYPVSGPQDRNLKGTAEIRDFSIVKAPTMARLLGALSLPGVLSLLNDQGLSFSKMKADVGWVFREPESMVVFKNGRTSGNSLGLTFEGNYDFATDKIDMNGTIVPLSEVNNMISKIPLVGDILTGGSNSIFAATYSVEGPSDNPDVMVNPLAVLAPGILREILFE